MVDSEPGVDWQLLVRFGMLGLTGLRIGEEDYSLRVERPAVEIHQEEREDQVRIEKEVGVIDQFQTNRVVDHDQRIDLGKVQTLCDLPNLPLNVTAIRCVGGRWMVAGVVVDTVGRGENVGRPPRIELTAVSNPALEIVVVAEDVVDFD